MVWNAAAWRGSRSYLTIPGTARSAISTPGVVDPAYGRVDNIFAVHSLNPRGMAAHLALYESAMAGTPTLRKVEREIIALVVSLENDCHY